MTHWEKVQDFISAMSKAGVRRNHVAPPLHRLLWRLGIRVAPPHFQGFVTLSSLAGGFFGLGMLLGFSCFGLDSDLDFWFVSLLFGIGGIVFGVYIAEYYRLERKEMKLPSWGQYQPGFRLDRAPRTPQPFRLPSWLGYSMWGAAIGLFLVTLGAFLIAYLQDGPFGAKNPPSIEWAFRFGIPIGLGVGGVLGYLFGRWRQKRARR